MQEGQVSEKTTVQPLWLTALRILLGFILAWKGIVFIRDYALLEKYIGETGVGFLSKNANALAFVVSYLSLLSGLFIACGLWTKLFSIIQLPILIVAIFFVNIKGIGESPFESILSIITLVLLIVFIIKGSGKLSADEFFRTYYKAGTEKGKTKNFFNS
ncbi:MAG: DoxX family protein [Ginsengibacter sp.]